MSQPLIIESAVVRVNAPGADITLSKEQLWEGFKSWAKGDKRFVPDFVDVEILSDDGTEVLKDVKQYGKSSMADGSPNLQKSTFRDGYLVVTEYLAGPWFMALYYIGEDEGGELQFHLTTLRHTQHPDFIDPLVRAKDEGAKPPPTLDQNIARVLGVIRKMAQSGEL